jgi:hypothetical protein
MDGEEGQRAYPPALGGATGSAVTAARLGF